MLLYMKKMGVFMYLRFAVKMADNRDVEEKCGLLINYVI